jgi:two-component system, sensor histidine kinase and response regulator
MAGKPLILCVDDTSNELEGRKMLLEENGFEVLTASNGIEALRAFVSHPVDLVLLGYHMPRMNGDVAAERMKACKPDVPLALLSADDRVPESELNAVDVFVSKSEPITTFLAIVDHLLSLRFLFQPLRDLETGEGRSAA